MRPSSDSAGNRRRSGRVRESSHTPVTRAAAPVSPASVAGSNDRPATSRSGARDAHVACQVVSAAATSARTGKVTLRTGPRLMRSPASAENSSLSTAGAFMRAMPSSEKPRRMSSTAMRCAGSASGAGGGEARFIREG